MWMRTYRLPRSFCLCVSVYIELEVGTFAKTLSPLICGVSKRKTASNTLFIIASLTYKAHPQTLRSLPGPEQTHKSLRTFAPFPFASHRSRHKRKSTSLPPSHFPPRDLGKRPPPVKDDIVSISLFSSDNIIHCASIASALSVAGSHWDDIGKSI